MFGINEILNKILFQEPLFKEDRFKILHTKVIDKKIIIYLANLLKNLHIEVLGEYKGTVLELMPYGRLEGWCWQTTESAIVFFNDDDYIERGNLLFDDDSKKYYHSWICFKYKGTEYVLDPCLNFVCKKKDYDKIFVPEVQGRVTAKAVKETLIEQIEQKKNEPVEEDPSFNKIWEMIMGDYYKEYEERTKDEVVLQGSDDINDPLYRNDVGYKMEMEDKKIKKLTAHYYLSD